MLGSSKMNSSKQPAEQGAEVSDELAGPGTTRASSVPSDFGVGVPIHTTTSTASDIYGSRPACFNNTVSECLFVLTTTFAVGQTAILNGMLMVMSARVQEGLNMNMSEVTWLVAGMTLTSGAFLLFFGRVADLFGRRSLLVYSMGLFTIFNLVSGFSQNAIMLEILLALAGVTCASVVPPAIGKLGAIYDKPSRRKNRAFACFSAGNPIGFVLGALVGGIVTDISSWRAAFWVVAVIYAPLTVAAWFITPHDAEQNLGGFNWDTMKQMDWLGALLAISGLALFTASFTLAPDSHQGWATPYVIAMLVVGVVLMAAFLYWQSIFKHPLMPLGVWRDKNFSLLVASLCLEFYGFNGNFFWTTLGWQRAYIDSPLMVAVKMLPAAIGGTLVNLLAALLMHRVSNKLLSIGAALSMVIGSVLLSVTSKNITYWALFFPSQLFSVLGADISFCVTTMVSAHRFLPHLLGIRLLTPTLVRNVVTAVRTAIHGRRNAVDNEQTRFDSGTGYLYDGVRLRRWQHGSIEGSPLATLPSHLLGELGRSSLWLGFDAFFNHWETRQSAAIKDQRNDDDFC